MAKGFILFFLALWQHQQLLGGLCCHKAATLVGGLVPGTPTSRMSLAEQEGSGDISALSILVPGRWDTIKDPVCLPGNEVLEQLPVAFAGTINVIRFRGCSNLYSTGTSKTAGEQEWL